MPKQATDKITRQMILAGVVAFDDLRFSVDSEYLVTAIYSAMWSSRQDSPATRKIRPECSNGDANGSVSRTDRMSSHPEDQR